MPAFGICTATIAGLMKFFKRMNGMLDRGVSKQIFDHVRNYMICAFILAVGTTELRRSEPQFFDLIPAGYSGLGVIALAIVMIVFNLYDGIRRIYRIKYHNLLIILLVALYVFFSIRVIEMAWDFRDLGNPATL